MSQPSCLTADRLTLYLEDALAPPEREAAEEHLSHCLVCRDRLAGTLKDDDEDFSLPASESLKQAARAIPRRRASNPWWGAAAAVLLAALGLTFHARFGVGSRPGSVQGAPTPAVEGT